MTCKYCSLRCIATGCECICHTIEDYQLLKLPRQETAHYFHNGRSICGRSNIGMNSKTFKPDEKTLICRNCEVTLEMRQKWIANNSE